MEVAGCTAEAIHVHRVALFLEVGSEVRYLNRANKLNLWPKDLVGVVISASAVRSLSFVLHGAGLSCFNKLFENS